MTEIRLYFAPGSCSRVSMISLLEAGADFEPVLVRFMKGEHRSPDFMRLNPKSKVPLLVVDDEPLTENVAILTFLNGLFPDAALLPPVATPLDDARQVADLCFCSATLHPVVTRLRIPGRFADREATRSVWDKAAEAMREHFQIIEDRLASGPYWYGRSWSAIDAYIGWVFWRVEGTDFPVADYPRCCEHFRLQSARPSFDRAMAIEAAATATLAAEGLAFRPPPPA